MATWQLVIIAVAAILAAGRMSLALVRLFSRRAAARAVVRPGSAVESGLVTGTVPEGARVFDGWSYRVGARFAGRVRLVVYPDRVAVAGPRVPRRLYELWMWAQGILLALVPPALVAAIVTLDWRWLLAAFALWIISFGISAGGAGLWPGLGEVANDKGHFQALEFARSSVCEVDTGPGWAKGGLEVVLLPYVKAIDQLAAGRAVSFFAPDELGREVRFAIDVYTPEQARELSELLCGQPAAFSPDPRVATWEKSMQNRSMPPSTIVPELVYPNLDQAVAWLCQTLGFEERLRIANHRSQLVLGDASVVAVGRGSERETASGQPLPGVVTHSLMVRVADVDRHYEQARRAGAHITAPPATFPYGERQYTLQDIGGHYWTFSQSVADVAPEEWGGRLVEPE